MEKMGGRSAQFIEVVTSLQFPNAFNPYADICSEHDLPDAPQRRIHNLRLALDAAVTRGVTSIWVARDLGYRGGRRTGLALTDEIHLHEHAALLGVERFERSTRGPAMKERTATVVWDVLRRIGEPIFLWNVCPLHTFVPGDEMTNRSHSRGERRASLPLLIFLLDLIQPTKVVAIGNDATSALTELGVLTHQVRHPSYGGQAQFVEGIAKLYKIDFEDKGERQRHQPRLV